MMANQVLISIVRKPVVSEVPLFVTILELQQVNLSSQSVKYVPFHWLSTAAYIPEICWCVYAVFYETYSTISQGRQGN
jgi:hypothetical protein